MLFVCIFLEKKIKMLFQGQTISNDHHFNEYFCPLTVVPTTSYRDMFKSFAIHAFLAVKSFNALYQIWSSNMSLLIPVKNLNYNGIIYDITIKYALINHSYK